MSVDACMRACAYVCVRACVCACRVCVCGLCACVRACACVHALARARSRKLGLQSIYDFLRLKLQLSDLQSEHRPRPD